MKEERGREKVGQRHLCWQRTFKSLLPTLTESTNLIATFDLFQLLGNEILFVDIEDVIIISNEQNWNWIDDIVVVIFDIICNEIRSFFLLSILYYAYEM